MTRLAILGSTGSVGVNTLDVVRQFPDRFRVVGLAAGRNTTLLAQQVKETRPAVVSVADDQARNDLLLRLSGEANVEVLVGTAGSVAVAVDSGADTVMAAMVGAAGLAPVMAAARAGKRLCLADKETMVMAGALVTAAARGAGASVIPVDSEHNAIFQCLVGHNKADLKRIILTASGGPFLATSREEMAAATTADALNHPRWKMGRKISIDSATLVNKGLEVIEARWLFDVPVAHIDVHIHPEAIVHSLVEYRDGSVIAQLGIPDMRLPIAYALAYPERLPVDLPSLDLPKVASLTFAEPDRQRFPALDLAYRAAAEGGTSPIWLNAANEEAVQAFLEERIGFLDITTVIEESLSEGGGRPVGALEAVFAEDGSARRYARRVIGARGSARS